MKYLFKIILKYYLKFIAKLVLMIHKPTIIAIAGSANKYFVKESLKKILEKSGKSVKANQHSFNTEIGLPLAILDLPSGYNSFKKWLPIALKAPTRLFKYKYPEYLILEIGISEPKDMKYLLSIIKPKISIITEITQRYLEKFSSLDLMLKEFQLLVKKTDKKGLVILNADNNKIRTLSKHHQNIKYFGFDQNSNIQIFDIKKTNFGQKIILKNNDIFFEETINRYGKHHAYVLAVSKLVRDFIHI